MFFGLLRLNEYSLQEFPCILSVSRQLLYYSIIIIHCLAMAIQATFGTMKASLTMATLGHSQERRNR